MVARVVPERHFSRFTRDTTARFVEAVKAWLVTMEGGR